MRGVLLRALLYPAAPPESRLESGLDRPGRRAIPEGSGKRQGITVMKL